MKQIKIADATLCRDNNHFSFKEKIEIARQLENLNVDVIEFPEITNAMVDTLIVKTISSFVKNSVISVAAGIGNDSVDNAISALCNAKHAQIRIELPVSAVGMEYTCHKKPDKILAHIENCVKAAKAIVTDVEFCAVDATRAEEDFLKAAIDTAISAGATSVSVCDSAANMLWNGEKACTHGCLGFGVCAAVCPNSAVCIENGIAHIDTRKCTGCGLCAKACPNHIIKLLPDTEKVIVTCVNHEKGAVARKQCENGCIACKKCEKACEHDAIHVVNNLAEIDYGKCTSCQNCVAACPVGCIKIWDMRGIHRFNT